MAVRTHSIHSIAGWKLKAIVDVVIFIELGSGGCSLIMHGTCAVESPLEGARPHFARLAAIHAPLERKNV